MNVVEEVIIIDMFGVIRLCHGGTEVVQDGDAGKHIIEAVQAEMVCQTVKFSVGIVIVEQYKTDLEVHEWD